LALIELAHLPLLLVVLASTALLSFLVKHHQVLDFAQLAIFDISTPV